MSILTDVKTYYRQQRISPTDFRCQHLDDCRRDHPDFTEGREPMIGVEYDKGSIPRLLFLSLDPGSGDPDPQDRTAEHARTWEEEHCDVNELPKNRHWYRTHELAYELLAQLDPRITLENVHRYFASTNSAKCSVNNDHRAMADWRMFYNCRAHVGGELAVLEPDILVTQGDQAKATVEATYGARVNGDMKRCGYGLPTMNGRDVLWLHSYHPRYFGGFHRQRRECRRRWADLVRTFMASRPDKRAAEAHRTSDRNRRLF